MLSLVAQPLAAATYTWNGTTTGNWSVGGNWSPSAPTGTDATDILVFGGTGTATYQAFNDIAPSGGPFALNQLQFGATPTTVAGTLAGNTLSFSGVSAGISAANLGSFTVLNKLFLNNDFGISGVGTGAITLGRFGMTDVLSGPGNLTIGGGARINTIYGNNSGFSGNITVSTGTLAIGNATALGTGTLTMAGSTTLRAAVGPSGRVMNTVNVNGTLTLGAVAVNGLDLGGTINLGGGNRTLSTAGDVLISGAITNGAVTKSGAATLILSGANTYAGGTTISAGSVRVTAGGNFGQNLATNNVTVAAGAILRLLHSGAIGSQQTLTATATASALPVIGVGFNVLPQNIGSLGGITSATSGVFALDGLTYTRSLDLNAIGDGNWFLGATNWNGRYRGASLLAGAGNVYRLGGGGGTLRLETTNLLTGTAGLQIGAVTGAGVALTNSAGTVILATAQNYSGATTVQSGTLVVVGNSSLGSNNAITVAGGSIDFRTTNTFAAIDAQYASRNLTFTGSGGLNYGVYNGGILPTIELGSLTVANPGLTITTTIPYNISIGNPMLRINGTTTLSVGTTTFNVGTGAGLEMRGQVTGVSLTKSGGGRLTLSASNSISGTTTVTAGLLALHNTNALTEKLILTAAGLELRADGFGSNQTIGFSVGSNTGIEISGASSILVDGLTGVNKRNTIELTAATSIASATNLTIYGGGQGAGGLGLLQGDEMWGGLPGGAYRLLLSGPMTLTGATGAVTFSTFGAELEIAGNITGSTYTLTKAAKNNLVLSGASVFSGTTSVDRGALIIKNNAALSGITGVNLGSVGGTTLSITWNTDLFLGSGITFNKPITVATITGPTANFGSASLGILESGTADFGGDVSITRDILQLYTLLPSGTANFNGVLSGTGGITKIGLGTAVLNPSTATGNTFTGGVTLNAGTLVGVGQTSGSPFGAATAIRINAGSLILQGIAATTSTTGHALTIAGGARIGVDSSAGGATTLGFTSVTRSGVGTLSVIPYSAGTNTLNIAGLSVTNGILSPWIVRQTSQTDSTGTFAGLSGSSIVAGAYSAAVDINAATSTTVFRATGATTNALSANRSTYALTSDGQAVTGSATLTVGSGGVILNNGASIGVSLLAFGSAEGLVYVGGTSAGTATATISSPITTTAANALTKFGPGTLVLSGANTYTGATNVNEGTLKLGAENALPGGVLRSVAYGTTLTIGPDAVFDMADFNQSLAGLNGDGTLLLGSGDLTVGFGNVTSTFSGQFIGGGGSKLIKVGTGTLSLLNSRLDLPNSLEELVVQQGAVVMRLHGEAWAGPIDLSTPLPTSTLITLRGGNLQLRYADEVGNAHQDFLFRNNVVVAANSTLQHDRLEQDGTGSKTFVMGNLTIGSQTLTTTGGALHSFVFDQTTLTGNAVFSTGIGLALNGAIHGSSTINKIGTSFAMYVAADNTGTFSGGIVVNGGGLYFADRIGGLPIYSATANAGSGHVLLNPSANTAVRLASAANIRDRLFVFSNPTQLSRVELLADIDLATLALNARGSGELGLGSSSWTTPIDMSRIGDGSWYLGSFLTNGEGSGSTMAVNYTTTYMPDTLGAGKDNVYRFGGGNFGNYSTGGYGILAIQNANVLTGSASVVIGAAPTVTALGGTPLLPSSTTGTLQLNADQNYRGNTTIYRGSTGGTAGTSTLDFRGTLASPRIEVLGTLAAVGAGRFTTDGLTNINNVILRPGSMLSLDYGLNSPIGYAPVDNTAPQLANGFVNKWGDDVVLDLYGATLDLASASVCNTASTSSKSN
ncbi:MAG: autotransporter-associated beta strand repeat-containing protein [Pirellulales bacterium]